MEKQIFKVGDRVYHIKFDWGVISEISSEDIFVGFDNGRSIWVSSDGNLLSFTEYTLQGFTQERPIELPEVGELCLVRDNKGAVWHVRHFEGYIPSEVACFKTDSGYWEQMKRIKILD